MRSSTGPRCASIENVLIWLSSAACSYLEPARICNDHSRRKSTAKMTSAIAARIATRSAIRGVKRYGSSTLGSRREEALGPFPVC